MHRSPGDFLRTVPEIPSRRPSPRPLAGSKRELPAPAIAWTEQHPEEVDLAIVGGGFSGLMALVHLRRLLPEAAIALFERRRRAAPGVAYGACGPDHLLNVPAGRMGALPGDPGGFHAWLESSMPGRFGPAEFVPRSLYGRYLTELAAEAAVASPGRTWLVADAIVHVERTARVELFRAAGASCVASSAILAPGIPAARAPWVTADRDVPRHLLAADPWDPRAMEGIESAARVAIVGSGLTAVDVAIELRRRGFRGTIAMISRNGRLPLPHAPPTEPPAALSPDDLAGSPRDLLRSLRRAARRRIAAGLGWQATIDALRAATPAIWSRWSAAQRGTFLRRLRPFWEIHRHRCPLTVLDRLEAERAAGTLAVERGVIDSIEPRGESSLALSVRRPDGSRFGMIAGRLFNCVGPATAIADTIDPLIGSLLRSGLARPDPIGIGLDTDPDGRLIGSDGSCDGRLLLAGALRRGTLWESTAVPELRIQARRAAEIAAAEAIAARPGRLGSGAPRSAAP
ncbi:MAG TPA: FAD/NAD(P)-binding protein [Phycisphaerales bacterium]|nr:FAD/NAD(P)-binding protein [Phycisphaerales bacterium]HMP37359.1 FAD/NAD(P)-binding protein [Phycisphaerales bacterium]